MKIVVQKAHVNVKSVAVGDMKNVVTVMEVVDMSVIFVMVMVELIAQNVDKKIIKKIDQVNLFL